MTHLRKMMLEELQRRNYAETTIDCYLRAVEDFSRHFHSSPDRLGPRHIREYQAALFHQRKFSPNTVAQHLAALRFFYTKTLKKTWSITETPYPKKALHLPTILSQEEVTRLINAARPPLHRTLLMALYATGLRRAELARLKVSDVDSQRMVIHVQGGKGRKDRDVLLSARLLIVITPAITPSLPRRSTSPVNEQRDGLAFATVCIRTRCDTALPRICSKRARICVPSRCCWGIVISKKPPSICISRNVI